MLKFSNQEYQRRLELVKKSMEEKNIDVLLVTNPANMNYLTGYNAWSFYMHQMVAVFIDEKEPLWMGRFMDAIAARKTAWLQHENIVAYPDSYVQSTVVHPMDFVADILKERKKDKKRIAVEMDTYYFTAKCYEVLKENLPNAEFVNGHRLVNWVKVIKSDEEIEFVKAAGKIMSKGMNEAIKYLNVGVRKNDMAAEIYRTFTEGTEEFGGDYSAIVPLMPTGVDAGACHLTWTDEKYKEGDVVIFELAGCYQRYHSPMSRTISLGKPSEKLKETAKITIEGLNKVLDFIKPGVTAEEAESVWAKNLEKYGLFKESRIGYSTGLNYPPDWGEDTLSLRPGDKTILKPNMILHVIPGMYFEDFGVEISEAIRITEDGCETLADVERKLFIK
uniref:M24 family metallopeptidase n=1 Tax=Ndongobacter massiliensis TaxID=1871025 RepID=UPI00093102E6|nr:M24 family metallopeptidase [Ndongobacter massiliensis]